MIWRIQKDLLIFKNSMTELLMLETGVIVPPIQDQLVELRYYQEELEFWSIKLETRRKFVPDLFRIGSNCFSGKDHYPLNITLKHEMEKEFPERRFDTDADFQLFLNTPNWYWTVKIPVSSKEDILGNNYHQMENVFIRILPSHPLGPFDLYSLDEMIAAFLHYRRFVDPHDPKREFENIEMSRLEKLLSDRNLSLMLEIITGLKTKSINHLIDELRDVVSKEFFQRLLEIGFLMRGWSGEGHYPLRANKTSGKVSEKQILEKALVLKLEKCPELKLPLFGYNSDLKSFYMSTESLTIEDKLKMILNGGGSESSCIRLGSNWFVATAWYYLQRYYQIQPFSIDELEPIQ
jgi:hypothetical protein